MVNVKVSVKVRSTLGRMLRSGFPSGRTVNLDINVEIKFALRMLAT